MINGLEFVQIVLRDLPWEVKIANKFTLNHQIVKISTNGLELVKFVHLDIDWLNKVASKLDQFLEEFVQETVLHVTTLEKMMVALAV